MGEPIKIDDLVIVERRSPCCNEVHPQAGMIFQVKHIDIAGAFCQRCGWTYHTRWYGNERGFFIVEWALVRINDPGLKEEIEEGIENETVLRV